MRIFVFLFSLLVSYCTQANIEYPVLKGVHALYKPEYQKFSLVYAEIAKEGYLAKVRDRGYYGTPDAAFTPHAQLTDEQKAKDWPCDPVAQLMQHLYPSPTHDGLAPAPARPEDMIGHLNTEVVGRIVNYLCTHQNQVNENELVSVIWGTPEECQKNSKSLAKLLRGTKNFWQRRLARMIKTAIDFQQDCPRYPQSTLIHAFSALIFWKAETREDVQKFLTAMTDVVDQNALSIWDDQPYTEQDWEEAKEEMMKDPLDFIQEDIERAVLAEACASYLDSSNIPLVRQGYAFFGDKKFANCGETALNNLFNFYMFNPKTGRFDTERLRRLEAKYGLKVSPKFYALYENAPTGIEMRRRFVLNAWAEIVSGLPDVRYNKPEKDGVCDIKSRFSNHAFVIAHVLGDDQLLELAQALRKEGDELRKLPQTIEATVTSTTTTTQPQDKPTEMRPYDTLTAQFWTRLSTLFSDESQGHNDDDDNTSSGEGILFGWKEAEKIDKVKQYHVANGDMVMIDLTRSDIPEYNAQFRILGDHGKFVAKKAYDESQENFNQDRQSRREKFSEFLQKDNGVIEADYFVTLAYDFEDYFMRHVGENSNHCEEIEKLSSTHPENFLYAHFTELFDDECWPFLCHCLEKRLTHLEPLFYKRIQEEIETSHMYGLTQLIKIVAEFPDSFLKDFPIWQTLEGELNKIDQATVNNDDDNPENDDENNHENMHPDYMMCLITLVSITTQFPDSGLKDYPIWDKLKNGLNTLKNKIKKNDISDPAFNYYDDYCGIVRGIALRQKTPRFFRLLADEGFINQFINIFAVYSSQKLQCFPHFEIFVQEPEFRKMLLNSTGQFFGLPSLSTLYSTRAETLVSMQRFPFGYNDLNEFCVDYEKALDFILEKIIPLDFSGHIPTLLTYQNIAYHVEELESDTYSFTMPGTDAMHDVTKARLDAEEASIRAFVARPDIKAKHIRLADFLKKLPGAAILLPAGDTSILKAIEEKNTEQLEFFAKVANANVDNYHLHQNLQNIVFTPEAFLRNQPDRQNRLAAFMRDIQDEVWKKTLQYRFVQNHNIQPFPIVGDYAEQLKRLTHFLTLPQPGQGSTSLSMWVQQLQFLTQENQKPLGMVAAEILLEKLSQTDDAPLRKTAFLESLWPKNTPDCVPIKAEEEERALFVVEHLDLNDNEDKAMLTKLLFSFSYGTRGLKSEKVCEVLGTAFFVQMLKEKSQNNGFDLLSQPPLSFKNKILEALGDQATPNQKYFLTQK